MPTKLHLQNCQEIDEYFIEYGFNVSVPMVMRKFRVNAEAAEMIIKNANRRRKNFDQPKQFELIKKRRKRASSDPTCIAWRKAVLEIYENR